MEDEKASAAGVVFNNRLPQTTASFLEIRIFSN
jgi:hypothetical protein